MCINKSFNNLILLRKFTTNIYLLKHQTGNFMNKVLKESKNKKKWQYNLNCNSNPLPKNLTKGVNEGKQSANSRRISILNKTFMRYITDLMATGNNSSKFLGRGIEINRVMVTPDFNGINVFWIAKGTENDENIEKLLNQESGNLRHELSQLRVMGVVPKINFIKDKQYAKLVEVDNLLAKADFGEDYVPLEPSYRFKSEFHLNTSLPENLKQKINNLNEEDYKRIMNEPEEEDEGEEELPVMRSDIFGLNHTEIMTKIMKSMKKSEAVHRRELSSIPINENVVEFNNSRQQKEAFQEFLMKRQLQRLKVKKENEKHNLEYDYIKEENIRYLQNEVEDIPKEIEDYIEETTDK